MLWLLVTACASYDLSGIWRFDIAETPATGDECEQSVFHNLVSAYEPEQAAGDTGWANDSSADQSERVVLGEITGEGDGGMLIIDGMVLLQQSGGSSAERTYAWQQTASSKSSTTHASGYQWSDAWSQSKLTRVTIEVPDGARATRKWEKNGRPALSGTWAVETQSDETWNEADTWPEDLPIGETGQLPSGNYLVRDVSTDDTGATTTEPAINSRDAIDCTEPPCVLTVSSDCLYSYELTATPTDLSPDDPSWPESGWDAGL